MALCARRRPSDARVWEDTATRGMTSGTIGRYQWAECDLTVHDVRLPDVMRALADHVSGLRAVNVSWDSGRLLPADVEIDSRWSFADGYAVSHPSTMTS